MRVAAIAVLGLLLVIRIALPFILEWFVPRLAADQNVFVEIGDIDLGLIAGEVTLEDVVVDLLPESDPELASSADAASAALAPLLGLARLHVAFEWTALLDRRIHLTEFELDHPDVMIVQRDDGTFRLPTPPTDPDDAENEGEEETGSATEEKTRGWEFALDRFELNTPSVSLRTETTHEEVVHLAADQLGFDTLSVSRDGIGLGGLDLVQPEVFVERQWLLGLGDGAAATDPQEPDPSPRSEIEAQPSAGESPPKEMIAIEMKRLKIERAAFTVRTAEGAVEVALRLDVADAGTARDQVFPLDLGLQIDDATIGVEGRLGLNPLSFAGRVNWQGLRIPPFLQLTQPDLVPWLASCDANGDIELEFHSDPAAQPAGLRIRGSIRVADVSFRQPETEELALAWDALEIEIREVVVPLEPSSERPVRVELSRVTLVAPLVVYTNPPDALDQLMALVEGGAGATEEPADAGAPGRDGGDSPRPEVTLDRLELERGAIRYVDRSVRPVHQTKIHELEVAIDGIANAPAPGADEIEIEGRIQSSGSFSLRGGLPGGRGKIEFTLRDLDLVTYDSLARGAGWQIDQGRTSLRSSIEADRAKYLTRNSLVLHDLRVVPRDGNQFASRFGVSVDVALAILRDAKGDIAIDAPVAIDGDGAGVDLAPVVVSALRTAIQGALSSPIKMLGMVVPEGEDSGATGAIAFAAGEDAPSLEARAQLESLADFSSKRPALALELAGHWSEDDRDPMARRMLREIAVAGDDFPEVEGAGFFARRRIAAALRERSEGGSGTLEPDDAEILERFVAALDVPESRLRRLAEARARAVRSALLEQGIPPEAISLGAPSSAPQAGVTIALDARNE